MIEIRQRIEVYYAGSSHGIYKAQKPVEIMIRRERIGIHEIVDYRDIVGVVAQSSDPFFDHRKLFLIQMKLYVISVENRRGVHLQTLLDKKLSGILRVFIFNDGTVENRRCTRIAWEKRCFRHILRPHNTPEPSSSRKGD